MVSMGEGTQQWVIEKRNDEYFLKIYNPESNEEAELMLDDNLVQNINKLKIVKPKSLLPTIVLGFLAVAVFTLGLILSLTQQVF